MIGDSTQQSRKIEHINWKLRLPPVKLTYPTCKPASMCGPNDKSDTSRLECSFKESEDIMNQTAKTSHDSHGVYGVGRLSK